MRNDNDNLFLRQYELNKEVEWLNSKSILLLINYAKELKNIKDKNSKNVREIIEKNFAQW